MPAPAQLVFVRNLLTNKAFLAQLATAIVSLATAAGVKVLEDQQTVILILDIAATMLIQYAEPGISLTAPISAPAPKDVPAGTSVVTVVPANEPQAATAAPAVQPVPIGTHTVEVQPPLAVGLRTPGDVVITPAA